MKKIKWFFMLILLFASLALSSCTGDTPYIGENGNWWIGNEDTGICAQGPQGEKGEKGEKGENGERGENGQKGETGDTGTNGKSAYESYCEEYGYTKSEAEWLAEINNALTRIDSEDIYEIASKATLVLECYNKSGVKISTGSAFIISADGIIATAHHVMESAYSIKASFLDGTSVVVNKVVGFDSDRDIALLKIGDDNEYSYLNLETNGITPGETAYSFGIPLGFLEGSFSSGVVASQLRTQKVNNSSNEQYDVVQFTAPISAGNSGGPLLNSKGNVIGIVTSKYTYGEALNLATYIDEIKNIDLEYERTVADFYADTVYYQTKFGDDEHNESESNANTTNANQIGSGYTMYGACSYTDSDLYKLTIDGDESVQLTIACLITGNMSILLGNSDLDVISLEWYSFEYQDYTFYYTNITLDPGTYYIQTKASSYSSSYGLYTYWKTVSEHNAFAYDIYKSDFLN